MTEIITFLQSHLADHFVLSFIPLYILGGRPGAVLGAQLLGYQMTLLLPVVVALDALQVPFFDYLLGSLSNSALLQRLKRRGRKKKAGLLRSGLFRWIQLMGAPGVVVVSMLPLKGCGMLSGVLLYHLLKLSRPVAYPLLIAGSISGCLLLVGLGEFIAEFWGQLMAP